MKKVVVLVFCLVFALGVTIHNCWAGDPEKLAALKKIEGTYVLKRLSSYSDLGGREITFSLESDCLVVLERGSDLPERRSRISLNEVSEKDGGGLTFGYNFQGDISTSKLQISPEGKMTGWSGRSGRTAEIEFRKK